MYFFFGGGDRLDDEMTALMGRIVENVSFGLDVLAQEAERSAAERQKERTSRMLEALSATNEAIMRGKNARGAVPAGVRGSRRRREILLHRDRACARGEDFFEIAAVAGPTSERVTQPEISTARGPARRPRPDRHGLSHAASLRSATTISRTTGPRPWRAHAERLAGGRGDAADDLGQSRSACMLFMSPEKARVHARIRRAAAAAGRQRVVRAGEVRSGRRERGAERGSNISPPTTA